MRQKERLSPNSEQIKTEFGPPQPFLHSYQSYSFAGRPHYQNPFMGHGEAAALPFFIRMSEEE